MVQANEVMKLGDKYYLIAEVQKILEARTKPVPVEDIEGL